MRRHLSLATLAVLPLAAAATAAAGPITPPAGPVSGTHKTLSDVEPRRAIRAADIPMTISTPGSYYLAEDISTSTVSAAILISASDVTLDLGGFTLRGPGGPLSSGRDGVRINPGTSNVCVRNGVIKAFPGHGLTSHLAGANIRISGIRVSGCSGEGILAGGIGTAVDNCSASGNGDSGFQAGGPGTTFTNCVASGNGAAGFHLPSSGATARTCTAYDNTTHGFWANTGFCDVAECKAFQNDGDGFCFTNVGATVRDCIALTNGGDGIEVSGSSRVVGNNCCSNGLAVAEGAGVRITGSNTTVDGNTLSGNDVGIRATLGANLIVRNSLSSHSGGHIVAAAGNNVAQLISSPGAAFTATNPWANLSH